MRKRSPFVPGALILGLLVAHGVSAREGKRVTPKELLKEGFFQDFEELDLETLLTFTDVTQSVASRSEQPPAEAPGSVTIVTGDSLRAAGARTLDDALRLVPGVDITVDALGRLRIGMRGMPGGGPIGASENVLIMLNGQRLDDPIEGGATAINFEIPVGNIQKIEVLRGAGSALYGSGAIGGVVNIITFTSRDFTGIEATAGGGSFETQDYALRLGSEGKSLRVAGYVEFEDSQGARRFVGADAQTLIDEALQPLGVPAASLAPGRATDGLKFFETNYTATYKDYDFQLRVSTQRSPGFIGAAEALGTGNDLIHRQINVGVTHRQDLDGWTIEERASFDQNDARRSLQAFPPHFTQVLGAEGSVSFPAGVFTQEDLTSQRYGLDGMAQKSFEKHQLQVGLVVERESTDDSDLLSNYDFQTGHALPSFEAVTGAVSDESRAVFSAFAQDIWSRSSLLTITSGLRFDHYGGAGDVVSPRLAGVFRLPKDVDLKLLYSRGFRVPTFAEEYFDLPGYVGNPDLKPMIADSLEASASYTSQRLRLTGSVFQTFLKNEIIPMGVYDAGLSRLLVNGPERDIRGVEVEVRQGFGVASTLFVDYTLQHADAGTLGNDLAGVPSSIGNVGATLAFARNLKATPSVEFSSSRPRALGDPRAPVPAYALVNFALRAPDVYRGVLLSISLQNLLNKLYFDPSPDNGVPGDYPRPGRRVFVSATYQF